MLTLTPLQREAADLLLTGVDAKKIALRLNLSSEEVSKLLAALREAAGVDTHSGLMAVLRHARRKPDLRVLEKCRKQPRAWWMV